MASDGTSPDRDRRLVDGGGDGRQSANSVDFLDSTNSASLFTNNIATFGNPVASSISTTRYRNDGSSIFSTPPNSNSTSTPMDSPELPEKVRHYTSEFCAEFKRLMDSFGDKVVENLTPMTIEVLEQLQEVITNNQRAVDEIDVLREEKQQLITQYEREKQSRRQAEQRLMSLEDETAVVESESQKKIDELESVVRVLELRAKNEADHAVRLEEREGDIKKDYQKLHDKYTDLWRTHADNIERTKILLGPSADELLVKAKTGPIKEARALLLECAKENILMSESSSLVGAPLTSRQFSTQSSVNMSVAGGGADRSPRSPNPALHAPPLSSEIVEELSFDEEIASRSMEDMEERSKFGEETGDSGTLEVSESYDGDEPHMESTSSLRAEIEEGLLLPSLGNAMSREIDNLIAENKELLDMKNALNVVKNDLLTRVEELGGEVTMRDDELMSLKAARDKYKQRLQDSEDKFRLMRDGYEQKLQEYFKSEENVPSAEQKRFTRAEMHRVVKDRNRYKEQLMELQEQIRWRERKSNNIVTADTNQPRGGIWSYFRGLFKQPSPSSSTMPTSASSMTLSSAAAGPLGGVSLNAASNRRSSAATLPANTSSPVRTSAASRARGSDLILSTKVLGGSPIHNVNPFADGRVEAFGWSVPQSHVVTTPTAPIINHRGSTKQQTKSGGDVAYKNAIETANLSSTLSTAVLNQNVPVPVHCRPIEHFDSGMKIWCATGVDLTPARSRNGDLLSFSLSADERRRRESSGSSLSSRQKQVELGAKSVQDELSEFEQNLETFESSRPVEPPHQLSSYVWLCSSTHSMSQVSIIDADRPDHVLASFNMHSTQLLCCVSVPGVQASHYPTRAQMDYLASVKTRTIQRPNITSKVTADAAGVNDASPVKTGSKSNKSDTGSALGPLSRRDIAAPLGSITFVKCSTGNAPPAAPPLAPVVAAEVGTPTNASATTFNITQVDANYVNSSKIIQSYEPTVWLGGQDGVIYAHSAVNRSTVGDSNNSSSWSDRLFRIQLQDHIITMVHCRGRMFIACADGQVAVFHRYSRDAVGVSPALEHVKEMQIKENEEIRGSLNSLEGFWDISSYHLIDIGKPQHSVRCMCVVGGESGSDDAANVWACYRNKVHVLDPITLRVRATFDAHPREESSVRNLAWHNDGVWVSIRLDSTLRLFHAYTYEHLQDVDVEPFVGCMLRAQKTLGFTLTRITALLIACRQLWIGTSNGVIVTVPLSNDENLTSASSTKRRGRQQPLSPKSAPSRGENDAKTAAALTGDNEIHAYAGSKSRSMSATSTGAAAAATSLIPFCAIADARISCLGHKDVVKFFVAVPAGASLSDVAEKDAAKGSEAGSKSKQAKAKVLSSEEDKRRSSSAGSAMLIMSGGEGCVDFRHPDNDDSTTNTPGKDNPSVAADGNKPAITSIDDATTTSEMSASGKSDDVVNILSSAQTQNSRTAMVQNGQNPVTFFVKETWIKTCFLGTSIRFRGRRTR